MLSTALAQKQLVSTCEQVGLTCKTCVPRYMNDENQCGWCGNVTSGSSSGLCISQKDYKLAPSRCQPFTPSGDGYRTGPPEAACLPLDELLNLIRIVNIIIAVIVVLAVVNSLCTGYSVRKRLNGQWAQVICWMVISFVPPAYFLVFSVRLWPKKINNNHYHDSPKCPAAVWPASSLWPACSVWPTFCLRECAA